MKNLIPLLILLLTFLSVGNTTASAQCMSGRTPDGMVVFNTTGNNALDSSIQFEGLSLAQVFGVNPTIYALEDSQSANALANCQNNQVMLGLRLLKEELWRMDRGSMAVAGIMAHEYAHIYQCKKNTDLSGKNRELQADYLASWYLRHEYAKVGFDVSGFARSLWAKGDTNFTSPNHHGTREERVQASVAGYNDRSQTAALAYAKSLLYLSGSVSTSPATTSRTCQRQVACSHRTQCTHQTECSHHIQCSHPTPCQHQGACSHRIQCGHRMQCGHPTMTPYGPQQMHPFDTQHPFDTTHQFDSQHQSDQAHQFDTAHRYDDRHPNGDVQHTYDTETYTCR